MSRVLQYIKDTRAEVKHIQWPTRSQAIWFTVVVVIVSLLIAVYTGVFDWVFTHVLEYFVF